VLNIFPVNELFRNRIMVILCYYLETDKDGMDLVTFTFQFFFENNATC